MELIFREMDIARTGSRTQAQAAVDETIPMIEGRQASKILCANGSVTVNKASAADGGIAIEGRIKADFICVDTDGATFAFTSSAPFTHSVAAANVKASMSAKVTPALQELEARLASGGIAISAIINLDCEAATKTPLRVVGGVKGVDDMEVKTRTVEAKHMEKAGDAALRMREEIPAANVASILKVEASAMVRDVNIVEDGAQVAGTLTVSALCANGDGDLSHLVQNIPFSENVPVSVSTQKSLTATARVERISMRPMGEEFAIAAIDTELSFELFYLEAFSAELPLDAFSPKTPFSAAKQDVALEVLGSTINTRVPLTASANVPDGMPDINRALYAEARPLVLSQNVADGVLSVEGILYTNILYSSDDGALHGFTQEAPFMQNFDAAGKDAKASVTCASATCNMVNARRMDLSYSLNVRAEVYDAIDASVLTGAEPCETPEAEHGIMICFAGEGETLFDIAKRFNVPRSALKQNNPDLSEHLEEGQKLLFML